MDDDDFIVVDDDAPAMETPRAGPSYDSRPAPTGIRSSLRKRNALPSYAELDDPTYVDAENGRRTRYSGLRNQPAPKLKLKLSEKAAAQAPGMSFLGPFDRELDSDDEDLVFEEQFILRVPPGEECDKLRKMVASREISNDVWFKFKGEQWSVARSEDFNEILTSHRCQIHDGRCFTWETSFTLLSLSTYHVSLNPTRPSITSKCSRSRIYVRLRPLPYVYIQYAQVCLLSRCSSLKTPYRTKRP